MSLTSNNSGSLLGPALILFVILIASLSYAKRQKNENVVAHTATEASPAP